MPSIADKDSVSCGSELYDADIWVCIIDLVNGNTELGDLDAPAGVKKIKKIFKKSY